MAVSGPKGGDSGGGGVFADINITPLTDIFLVLLIIFMVTTAVTIESAAHVDLPKAEAAANPNDKPKGIIVTYTADHAIMVNSQAVTLPQLQGALHDALDKSSDKIVIFQGDPKVILGDMVHILDIAKSAGAEAIAIAVSQLPTGGGPAPGGM
jgi:biopolymer transport protein ExbD